MTDREGFEAWARTDDGNCDDYDLQRDEVGEYRNKDMERDFIVWQASRRAALEKAIAKLEQMADEESTVEYKWAAASIRALAGATET